MVDASGPSHRPPPAPDTGDDGAYLPERTGWVAAHLDAIDAAGDTGAVSVQGRPVVVVTMRGAVSRMLRRVPVMRVEHDGDYLAVASKGGSQEHPAWYHNLARGGDVLVQDGTEQHVRRVRLLEDGPERDAWWARAVEAFPAYEGYQAKIDRQLPLFLLERRPSR